MLLEARAAAEDLAIMAAFSAAGFQVLFFIYFLGHLAINYVYGCVVATLAVVESPAATLLMRTAPVDDNHPDAPLPPYTETDSKAPEQAEKEPLIEHTPEVQEVQQEVLLATSKPITTSLRGTIRHLRARGTNGFHGLGVAALYFFLLHTVCNVFMSVLPGFYLRIFFFVAAQVMLVRISMLWTHIVISERSSRWWYQRIVPRAVARKVILPTAITSLIQTGAAFVPWVFIVLLGLEDSVQEANGAKDQEQAIAVAIVAVKGLITLAASVLYFVCLVVPSAIALVRVHAAQLQDDETPIVPFDRTFGGAMVLESEGGNGKLGLRDAWKSFDWNGRVRVIKIWVKMWMLQALLTVATVVVGFVGMAMLS